MKKLGIVGGIGPLATFLFGERLVKGNAVDTDQAHFPMIVLNDPQIPDRTSFLLGISNESPLPQLLKNIKLLEQLEVDVIALPCNTSYAFYEEFKNATEIPIINMVTKTAKYVSYESKTVGLLSTRGTRDVGVYEKACQQYGVNLISLDDTHQEIITKVIYNQVKASQPIIEDDFNSAVNFLKAQGCEKVILGCTELSVVKEALALDDFYVDAMDVLVKECIEFCK